MHVAANEVQPVNEISKLFVVPLRVERDTTISVFDVHVRFMNGSATKEPVSGYGKQLIQVHHAKSAAFRFLTWCSFNDRYLKYS